MQIKRALISVSDKAGIVEFAKELNEMGVEIVSTGGTAKKIRETGVEVKDISDLTGFPEMLDGRVKTLHPKVHGGLLALRDNAEHMATVKEHDIKMIDMVVVNLYPFEKTVANPDVALEEAIENIDIGGPSMLRSAAKNYRSVAVVTNPGRYNDIIAELKKNNGSLSEETLSSLAIEVFERTSEYDGAIYDFLKTRLGKKTASSNNDEFPEKLSLNFEKVQDLRYGENPHQKAAFYRDPSYNLSSVANCEQLHGKELSFNNIIDLDAAWEIVKEFDEPAAAVMKHTNPCGAACGLTLVRAYKDALRCDPLSAFGSIVGLNKPVDEDTAQAIVKAGFVECVIADEFTQKALSILMSKKNLRLIKAKKPSKADKYDPDIKRVVGGILLQDRDLKDVTIPELRVVTKKKPTHSQLESLLFGWKISKYVKSNTIVLCRGKRTVGVGAGQMSRVDSVIIAARKAGKDALNSTLASDAFFPKEDGIQAAAKAGATAIIQPGGSIRDEEVIKMADKKGLAMVFTGMRHFRH